MAITICHPEVSTDPEQRAARARDEGHPKPIRITIEVASEEEDAVLPWRYTVELARPPAGLLLHN
jgi:hypothetical protein